MRQTPSAAREMSAPEQPLPGRAASAAPARDDVRVRGAELALHLPQQVHQIVVGGDPGQERPVAVEYALPVDAARGPGARSCPASAVRPRRTSAATRPPGRRCGAPARGRRRCWCRCRRLATPAGRRARPSACRRWTAARACRHRSPRTRPRRPRVPRCAAARSRSAPGRSWARDRRGWRVSRRARRAAGGAATAARPSRRAASSSGPPRRGTARSGRRALRGRYG